MDFFYDGQVRRYVTQFMRFFIGFKWQSGDGKQQTIPVTYGDMTRQVAAIIKDNSENKMSTVPKISCYITGMELDTSRLADATYVSKINIRERSYDFNDAGEAVYNNTPGANYTIERLMPTPYKLTMKADIWTSNTDQKLQLLEQILVFFNPSFEIQTTDNYIDWTSLSVVNLKTLNFSSRTIPMGTESDIDICSLEFDMPIWVTTPAKVKKLGIVKDIITNIFNDDGSLIGIDQLELGLQDPGTPTVSTTFDNFGVLLLKSSNGEANDFDLSVLPNAEVHLSNNSIDLPYKKGDRIDWNLVIERHGQEYRPGFSRVYFRQPSGYEIMGTFTVNPIDPTYMVVHIDQEHRPLNSVIYSLTNPKTPSGGGRTSIDAIIDPYKFNPLERSHGRDAGVRYLVLDDVNNSDNVGGLMLYGQNPLDGSSRDGYDGPDAWKNANGTDAVIKANAIIEWSGTAWIDLTPEWKISSKLEANQSAVVYKEGDIVKFNGGMFRVINNIIRSDNLYDPTQSSDFQTFSMYITNAKTGVQYTWDGEQWLRSFEGEYQSGYWRLDLDP